MATCLRCGAASGEDARFCADCGAPLAAPPEREARKIVTILFCDLVESTKLAERFDPEGLQRLLARYFVGARTIVERHGGTVEKFIGDAVWRPSSPSSSSSTISSGPSRSSSTLSSTWSTRAAELALSSVASRGRSSSSSDPAGGLRPRSCSTHSRRKRSAS